MPLLHCKFFSKSLNMVTDVNVILPTSRQIKSQVLYLLHGAYGNYSDWCCLSKIELYVQKYNLVVVMPTAENSFYQDMYNGSHYLTFITQELPEYIKNKFSISPLREDTFVAGLSMGGYGAVKIAYEYPENYYACASLSGVLDIVEYIEGTKKGVFCGPFELNKIFENPEQLKGTKADLFALISNKKQAGKQLPALFQSCGKEDYLYPLNKEAKKKLENIGIDLTYEEHSGAHDWNYWPFFIQMLKNKNRIKIIVLYQHNKT